MKALTHFDGNRDTAQPATSGGQRRDGARLLRLTLCALLLIAFAGRTFADTTSQTLPGTCVDEPTGSDAGTKPWINTGNATLNDITNIASTALAPTGISKSHYLKCTNFKFNVPPLTTITGITMVTDHEQLSAHQMGDNHVFLVPTDGSAIGKLGKDRAMPGVWPVSFTGSLLKGNATYGGDCDAWDAALAACDNAKPTCDDGLPNVNHKDFGVAISVQSPGGGAVTGAVDFVTLQITYTPPNSPNSARLCLPQYVGVPDLFGTWDLPPAVDGTFVTKFGGSVDRDTGWTGAFRYMLENGTPSPDGTLQGTRFKDGDIKHYIYLSFQIRNDPTFDTTDAIVLGFDPDKSGTAAKLQRIIIYPVTSSGATAADGKLPAGQVKYWNGYKPTNAPNARWLNPATDPSFVTVVAHSAGSSPSLSWDVQVRIDNSAGLHLSETKDFGMYANLVRVNGVAATTTQFTWPSSTFLIPGANLEDDSLPAPTSWGAASLHDTSCTGVYISNDDIMCNGSLDENAISTINPNTFSATLHNSGAQPAQCVTAAFQIANYGLPADDQWRNPGALFSNPMTGNPVTAPLPVPARVGTLDGTETLTTGTWKLGHNPATDNSASDETAYYKDPKYNDQCIRVSLNSPKPGTVFSVQSARRNFIFGDTSEFVHDATVGTKGYRLAPEKNQHEFDLTVTRQMTPACPDAAVIARHPDLKYSQLDYVVHGCRHTGQFLTIKGEKYENCQSVGAFGYRLRHAGRVKEFRDELTGEGLKRAENNSYRLSVPAGRDAVLHTRVESVGGEAPGKKRGLCGEVIRPAVGTVLFLGMFIIGFAAYRPGRNND